MTFLPIVTRELRVAARSKATHRQRALIAGAVAALALLGLLLQGSRLTPSSSGAVMFRVLSILTLIFCVVEGARKTADCLSGEKRDGTLGLLFLTDLKGYDVVFGKLAATSLNSIYGLVAILPVLALPLLIGGVTAGEYWRVVLALLDVLFLSLSLGMFISALGRREKLVVGGAILLMAGWVVAPLLAFSLVGPRFFPQVARLSFLFRVFSPAHAFNAAFAPAVGTGPQPGYWSSLFVTLFWSWALLAGASWILPRTWEEGRPGRSGETWQRRPVSAREARLRPLLLNANPIAWLASRGANSSGLWLLVGLAALNTALFMLSANFGYLLIYLGGVVILNLILKMQVAVQSCRLLAEARRNNALESILSTPVTVGQIIVAQIRTMQRVFFLPIAVMLTVEFVGLLAGPVFARSGAAGDYHIVFDVLVYAIGYAVGFCLDFLALMWAGTWFGLASRGKGQAVTKTIMLILILPICAMIFPLFGVVFYFTWPLFWIQSANSRLAANLRNLAASFNVQQPANAAYLSDDEPNLTVEALAFEEQ